MTRDDIIRLASEAGFVRVVATHADGSLTTTVAPIEKLERFAALVAAAEREACAQVCDRITWSNEAKFFATAIRQKENTND
jgi:uncharacterized protein (DUF2126 family)